MTELTPTEIVRELDRHIVGQQDAKRAVAIAVRNRWRRRQLPHDVRDEVMPKNLILVGSTGVGKTEIGRRVSALVGAPFVKVEASKYTEVGYYGRDVDSMVRELVEASLGLAKKDALNRVKERAQKSVKDRLLDLLVGDASQATTPEERERREKTRSNFRDKLKRGELEDREVEVKVEERDNPMSAAFSQAGAEQMGIDLQGLLGRFSQTRETRRRVKVSEARTILEHQEAEKLIDQESLQGEAIRRAEETGIIFLDELDKIISSADDAKSGAQVSREGVQRDLLPIVEGSTVSTKYGTIQTDHILFMGAGAFHGSRPSDLIPELQGRFPIRVELASLTREDFARILREPEHALPRQYSLLLETEGVQVEFREDGLDRIAELAWDLNQSQQNIGARRLYALFEKLLEEPLFLAPDAFPDPERRVLVDRGYVESRLGYLLRDGGAQSYIL